MDSEIYFWASGSGSIDVIGYCLQIASALGRIDTVKLFLDGSHNISTADVETAISWSRDNTHTEIIDLLTDHLYRLDGPEYNKNII